MGQLGQPRAFTVVRQVLDGELREQGADVGLDRLDRQHELVGDRAVGGRHARLRALRQRATQGDQHAALHRRQVGCRDRVDGEPGTGARAGRRSEGQRRRADPHDVAVVQAPAPADALTADVRAVARQAVVDHRPATRNANQLGVPARGLLVPVQRDVARVAAADPQPLVGRLEYPDALVVVAVAADEERLAGALERDQLLELDRVGHRQAAARAHRPFTRSRARGRAARSATRALRRAGWRRRR